MKFLKTRRIADNFRLITVNVDHSDSASVKQQLEWALNDIKKYPGKDFL